VQSGACFASAGGMVGEVSHPRLAARDVTSRSLAQPLVAHSFDQPDTPLRIRASPFFTPLPYHSSINSFKCQWNVDCCTPCRFMIQCTENSMLHDSYMHSRRLMSSGRLWHVLRIVNGLIVRDFSRARRHSSVQFWTRISFCVIEVGPAPTI
jgi:hypothetical protein